VYYIAILYIVYKEIRKLSLERFGPVLRASRDFVRPEIVAK